VLATILTLTNLIVVVHVVVSLLLIVAVLLHSGRGGGLSDVFGGGMGAMAAGSTAVEKNLNRITFVLATAFMFSSATLTLRLQV
jgi:preprotein translocase subunit SecG